MIYEQDACLAVGWFAHELVFSGLSWPTLDKPFWLDVGNTSLSLKNFTVQYGHVPRIETIYVGLWL